MIEELTLFALIIIIICSYVGTAVDGQLLRLGYSKALDQKMTQNNTEAGKKFYTHSWDHGNNKMNLIKKIILILIIVLTIIIVIIELIVPNEIYFLLQLRS